MAWIVRGVKTGSELAKCNVLICINDLRYIYKLHATSETWQSVVKCNSLSETGDAGDLGVTTNIILKFQNVTKLQFR